MGPRGIFMSSLKFAPNLSLTLRRPDAEKGRRHDGVLYGAVGTQRLIVGGIKDTEFEVSEELNVWLRLERQNIGFWATVKEKFEGLDTLYFLSFPERVENSADLRGSERMPVFIPAKVNLSVAPDSPEERNWEGVLLDLSREGCCLTSHEPLEPNAKCKLSFSLPGDEHHYVLEGRVVRYSKRDAIYTHGFRFARDPAYGSVIQQISDWLGENLTFYNR